MKTSFSRENILKGALSQYDHYCQGYPGRGKYLSSLVMGAGIFKKTFSHAGSDILDSIIAYDRAEIDNAYIGQISMGFVSSFCGPEGLIWGYDLAEKKDLSPPQFKKIPAELNGITLKNGENLRQASLALFGTNKDRHFPFLPGSHVPCAGRTYTKEGPAVLYGNTAIGIAEDREKNACLIMEDIGSISSAEEIDSFREKLMLDAAKSVVAVGRNQQIKYKEIFVNCIIKKVGPDEIGCMLTVMPYFLLARKAFNENLIGQKLEDWAKHSFNYFLCNQNS